MITPKGMSKRVFGIGIIISGLLVLSIALILGLRFPAYVYTKAVQTQCILDFGHDQYEFWVSIDFVDIIKASKENDITKDQMYNHKV